MESVVNNTTEILLNGISTAANTGVRFPETAKPSPIKLYIKDSTKLAFTTLMDDFEKLRKSDNCSNFPEKHFLG